MWKIVSGLCLLESISENHQQAIVQRSKDRAQPVYDVHIYNTIFMTKVQRTSQKRRQEECKGKGVWKSVRECVS